MWIRHFVAAMAFTALGAGGAGAAPILLFEQDFESPSGILIGNACCTDISQQFVNTLFGTAFQQAFTVETIAIHGPSGLYSDPGGEGGNYALGLLSSVQNDMLSLTFDTMGLMFLNMGWTISPIAADQPRDPPFTDSFGTTTPTFALSLYDSPGGVFNLASLGSFTLLDTASVTGNAAAANPFAFNWSSHIVALDASGSTDGNVSIVFDLTAGGYAGFDNIVIAASDIAGELPGGMPPNEPPVLPVPESSTMMLLACGIAVIGLLARRRWS
jgi:hypothetical protein